MTTTYKNTVGRVDFTNKDYESFRRMMVEELKARMPEYTDLSETDAGIVLLEVLAKGLHILSGYQDVIANEAFLTTEEQIDNALKWCSMLGYTPRFASPAIFNQVFVLNSPQETETYIPEGTAVRTTESRTEPSIFFETTKDFIIPAGVLGNETDEQGNYLYTVPVEQGQTINGESLGVSSGMPSQTFVLNYSPVIVQSIKLFAHDGDYFQEWERVDNFMDSNADSRHYMVSVSDFNITSIIFGDGVFGMIPPPIAQGIFVNYRIGGGEQGNVAPNKIVNLVSPLGVVKSTFNPSVPISYGKEKESLEEIKINAPSYFRTKWGTQLLDDYKDSIERAFPEISKVASIRDIEDNIRVSAQRDIDRVNIYYLMESGYNYTQQIADELKEFLDERIIVGTKYEIFPAQFFNLSIVANYIIRDRFDAENVKQQIESFMNDYFALGNYDFGKELSIPELESLVMMNVQGVKAFRIVVPSLTILTPSKNQIIRLTSFNLTLI